MTTSRSEPGPGHNNPPDPIEQILEQWDGVILEAENWLDGEPAADADQVEGAERVLGLIKVCKKELTEGQKSATGPLHKAWKDEVARWKIVTDDMDRLVKGLLACVEPYKLRQMAEQEEAKRAAYAEAERVRREAEATAAAASAADINAQRQAAAMRAEAQAAEDAASAAAKSRVKGLRTVKRFEVTDRRQALNWIATHDPEALAGFVVEYARTHTDDIAGVRRWTEKEAF